MVIASVLGFERSSCFGFLGILTFLCCAM
jgi:hypothetical protein